MTKPPPLPQFIGAPVRRREDPELITGRARFVSDIQLDNMLHLSIWRSPVAHGRISSCHFGEAEAIPGVVAVLGAGDLAPSVAAAFPSLTGAMAGRYELLEVPERFPLARDQVRYHGEAVAVILAENPDVAADALDVINICQDAGGGRRLDKSHSP